MNKITSMSAMASIFLQGALAAHATPAADEMSAPHALVALPAPTPIKPATLPVPIPFPFPAPAPIRPLPPSYTLEPLTGLNVAVAMANNVFIGYVGGVDGVAVTLFNGTVTKLPVIAGYTHVKVTGISPENGLIVGYATSGTAIRGLLWRSMTSQPLDMGAVVAETYPLAVNSNGVVVGTNRDFGGAFKAFVWTQGIYEDITPSGSLVAKALAISDSGYVGGYANFTSALDPDGNVAVRWTSGNYQYGSPGINDVGHQGLEDGTLVGSFSEWTLLDIAVSISASAILPVAQINLSGRTVGFDVSNSTVSAWTSHIGSSVETLLAKPVGSLSQAVGVDVCGNIFGNVTYPDQTQQAMIWQPATCDAPAQFTN